ncbi:MAG TPA: hypothetical protein PKC27_08365, partial [Methanomethylovorans sp.]|nr:hypothetical protein [Methanomethylovorans sp.]
MNGGIRFMDTFEIHDEEVNVEEIMRKIRENISKRKEQGTYPPELDAAARQMISDPKKALGEIADELTDLNINSDIQNNSYVISSHRPIVGKPLVKGREIVHGEVRRYVDPMIFKQITFNQNAVKVLNNAAYRISNIENTIGGFGTKDQHVPEPKTIRQDLKETDERLFDIEDRFRALKQQINDEIIINSKLCEMVDQLRADMNNTLSMLKTDMNNTLSMLKTDMKKENEAKIISIIAAVDADIEKKAWLAQMLDKRNLQGISQTEKLLQPPQLDTGVNYFVFEDRFRGAREDIAQRQ